MSETTIGKNEYDVNWQLADRIAARAAIAALEPQTPLGAKLILLALKGIDEGVLPYTDNTEEIEEVR